MPNAKDKYSPKLFVVCCLLFIFIGIYLRIEPAIFNLGHFSFDQGLDQILVKKLVVDHKINLVSRYTGLEGVLMGPYYTWLMTIPFLIFAGNPSGNIVFFTFLGILHAIACYFFMLRIAGPKLALWSVLLILFSPSFISASQIILSPAPITFLSIIYLFLIYNIIERNNFKYLPLLALLCSLFFQFEIGYAIFATPAAVLTIFLFKKRLLFNRYLFFSTITFLLPFAPQIIFDFRHQHLISSSILAFLTGNNQSLGSESHSFFLRLISRINMLWSDLGSNLAFVSKYPIWTLFSIALIVYGWREIFKHKQVKLQLLGKIIISLLACLYLGFLVYPGPIWPWYRAGVPTLFILLLAPAIYQIFASGEKIIRFLTTGLLIGLLLLGINPNHQIDSWRGISHNKVSVLSYQQQALDTIYEDAAGQQFALYVYSPPVYPYIWDYQLWWYANRKYKYLPKPYDVYPQANNPEFIYLLIEPEDMIHRLNGWKGNFSGLGKMIWRKELIGDITLEKWQFMQQPTNPNPLIRYVEIF